MWLIFFPWKWCKQGIGDMLLIMTNVQGHLERRVKWCLTVIMRLTWKRSLTAMTVLWLHDFFAECSTMGSSKKRTRRKACSHSTVKWRKSTAAALATTRPTSGRWRLREPHPSKPRVPPLLTLVCNPVLCAPLTWPCTALNLDLIVVFFLSVCSGYVVINRMKLFVMFVLILWLNDLF